MKLVVTDNFLLDSEWNPPPLKALRQRPDGTSYASFGRTVTLQLGHHASLLDGLRDARIVTSRGFKGLGDVNDGCSVVCNSNRCRGWALRAHRPRVVAKVIGVLADEPRFVLLLQPKLSNAPRGRHESRANRIEARLVPYVLFTPEALECAVCPGRNIGELSLAS